VGSLLGLAAAIVSLAACRHARDPTVLEARTLHASAPASPADGPLPVRATYFPPDAPRGARKRVPLLVVEPALFRREILFDGESVRGGLVTALAGEGFGVWLLGPSAGYPGPRALARGIVAAAESIAAETGERRFDLVGLALGAEGALRALEALTAATSPVRIRRVVFLGGGFDFAYPRSFAARVARVRGGPATALCTLDGDAGCAHPFRHPERAVPWLGVLPLADDDELRPARERFPFVAGFTRLPVLFVNGKADGIAPSESMYPLFLLWGSAEPDRTLVPKHLFLAGRENGFGEDYDPFALFAGERAGDEVWHHLAAWLADGDPE